MCTLPSWLNTIYILDHCAIVENSWFFLSFMNQINYKTYCCSSVAKLYLNLHDSMDHRMPGSPALPCLPEFAQSNRGEMVSPVNLKNYASKFIKIFIVSELNCVSTHGYIYRVDISLSLFKTAFYLLGTFGVTSERSLKYKFKDLFFFLFGRGGINHKKGN